MRKTDSIQHFCPLRRVGNIANHHFFGYYNKHPWDSSGRYLLAQRVAMFTGDLSANDEAEIGFFDLEDSDRFHVIGTTSAWNWQMGSQLQWLRSAPDGQIIFNSRVKVPRARGTYAEFCSTVYEPGSGSSRELPLPVYVVAANGKYALCVNYARFRVTHPTIGYIASSTQPELENAPENDGVYRMHIAGGEAKLIISLAQLCKFQPLESMRNAIHWVTHLEINPSSSRFLFIHRWTQRIEDETCFLHRLFSANPDGSNLSLLECTDHALPQLEQDFDASAVGTFDYEKSEYQISHPAWKDDRHIIVWGPHAGAIHYHLYDDLTGRATVIGENCLTENGHMTYSTDGKWLLSDTYPNDVSHERLLILYDVEKDLRYDIGSFYTDPKIGKVNRCDLHPRWSPDAGQVCIDSVHEGMRQMYIIDVSDITGNRT